MDWEEMLVVFFTFVVIIVPVVGFTARYAFQPLLETMVRLKEASAQQADSSEAKIARLTKEVQKLSSTVERLEEANRFEREIQRSALPSRAPTGEG